jgi:hypothetical protein
MGEYAEEAWQAVAHPGEPLEPEEPLLHGSEVAAARQEWAVQVKRRTLGHADCQGAPGYDIELGVVCYCGQVIHEPHPDDMAGPPAPLPASATTLQSHHAAPLVVPEETGRQVAAADSGLASAVNPADPILARIDVIDPTQPYTPDMVEEHLLEAVARLERGAHYERVCAEDVYDKTMRYEAAHARAILRAQKECGGAQDVRAAFAAVEVETEYIQLMIAKMKLKAIQGTMHSLRSVISAYQTISRSIGTAYGAAGRETNRNDSAFRPRF